MGFFDILSKIFKKKLFTQECITISVYNYISPFQAGFQKIEGQMICFYQEGP